MYNYTATLLAFPAVPHNSQMDDPTEPLLDGVFAGPRLHNSRMQASELQVELHSAELKKELSLPNLVLTQVLSILGLAWIGTAGKLGPSHLTFWMAAITLFYIPSAAVVIYLNNEMPLEGGLYQWAKLRFNEMTGFLVAWNMLLYVVTFVSEMGLLVANNLGYALGPSGAWLADNKLVIGTASLLVTAGLIAVARIGLAIGKWIHGFAGFMILFLFASMALFGLPHWFAGKAAGPPLSLAVPAFTLLNLNILGKMGFGALGGFDMVALFAGECRGADVAKTIRRSVWIATPIIAGSFVLGTACVLVFVKPADIDLISPITQVLNRGLQAAGFSGSATTLIGGLIICTLVGQALLSFNYASRLPLVAGWDHLLPAWFTRLHPRFRTPVGSIACLGGAVFVLATLTSLGTGSQEAYQLLQNASGIVYGLAYLVMFAIPLSPVAAPARQPSWALRVASLSGFAMTLLYVILSLFPIIDVPNRWLFTVKIGGVVLGLNLAGALFYWRADLRRKRMLG
jgi:amino acid transporter